MEGNNINLYINSSDEDGRRYGVTSFNIDVVSGTEITLPENENRWSFTSNVLGTNSVKERTDAIVSAMEDFLQMILILKIILGRMNGLVKMEIMETHQYY